jgi:MFS family permease
MKASRTRYSMVMLAIGLAMLSYMQRVSISQAAGPIARDLHISKGQMGYIFGAFGLSYALFEMPIGLLGDRLGVRRVLVRIVLAWSAFTALTGAAWNIPSLAAIRFLFGAGEAGCFPCLARMFSVWLPARERLTGQALLWAFTRWGGAITPPIALACISLFGWRRAFVCFAVLGLVWCIIFLAWFKDDPAQHKHVNAAELELLQASRVLTAHSPAQRHWLRLILTRQVAALCLQFFCFSYVWTFYITWLPTYLREGRGQTEAHVAALATLPLLFGGFGSLASGFIPRRLPQRLLALCGFGATAVLLMAIPHIRSVGLAMVAMGLASFASDLALPVSWDTCIEIGGAYTATVGAAMNMIGNLAGFVAPVVAGAILERAGGWNLLIETMSAAAVVSACCWLYLDPDAARRKRARLHGLAAEGINPDGVLP